MDNATLKILEKLDEGYTITNNLMIREFGFNNKEELYNKLKDLKSKGLVNYTEDNHELFKGEPKGKTRITQHGKDILNQYK